MELSYRKLTDAEIATALATLPEWTIKDGMLTRLFTFDDYQAGLDFAYAAGGIADELNHHPDIFIGYQKVRISMITHDAGGLTAYDFELARQIQDLD